LENQEKDMNNTDNMFRTEVLVTESQRAKLLYSKALLEAEKKLMLLLSSSKVISLTVKIVGELVSQLAQECDKIVLACFDEEFKEWKKITTPSKIRYKQFVDSLNEESFFAKYPKLLDMIKHYLKTSIQNITECIQQLDHDYDGLVKAGWIPSNVATLALSEVKIASSDRHNGGRQVLILTLSNTLGDNCKLVYKNRDLSPEKLLIQFVESLGLESPYDIKLPQVFGHCWVEFIPHLPLKSAEQVENYYRRAGSLLAVLSFLNTADMHLDNLIACGEYPVIIDGETILQSHKLAQRLYNKKLNSIMRVGLIQPQPEPDAKESNDSGQYISALQGVLPYRLEYFSPYLENDGTKNLELKYSQISEKKVVQNCPTFNGKRQKLSSFVDEFMEGYAAGFATIASCAGDILSSGEFQSSLRATRVRQPIRRTLEYLRLIRIAQTPAYLNQTQCYELLTHFLSDHNAMIPLEVVNNEMEVIKNLDIPHFTINPSEKGKIYGYNGEVLDMILISHSPMAEVWSRLNKIQSNPEECLQKDLELIARNLIQDSIPAH
jgi:lantibiotic modifying enzyme